MRVFSYQPVWLLVLGASPALGLFEEFFFAGNKGNATGPQRCGDMGYDCPAPSMCSKDTLTGKWFCCETGNEVGPCWVGSTKCEGQGTNVPSLNQSPCSNLNVDYCCQKDVEQCTKVAKQFNICWSTNPNPVRNLNKTRLAETYSSLSRATPSAASLTMNQQALLALTYTTPGASSATVSTTGSTSPASASASASATQTSSPPAASKAPGLSGAAIGSIVGGVVGGVVGGLALLGVLGFFLWRRKRNNTKAVAAPPATSDPYQPYGYQPNNQPPPNEAYSPQPAVAQLNTHNPPLDKYAHYQVPVEAPTNHEPAEMDASYYQQPHHRK